MATTSRNPLSQRSRPSLASPRVTKTSVGLKRPRSPGVTPEDQPSNGATKRVKSVAEVSLDKHRRRDQEEIEWREKYTRAFNAFKFHFSEDIQNTDYVKQLERRILQLGGVWFYCNNLFSYVLIICADCRRFLFVFNHAFDCEGCGAK